MRRLIHATATLLAVTALAACGGEEEASRSAAEPAPPATRTVEHAMGRAEVPGQAKRVVVLDTGELDTAVALGIKPVGATEAIAGEGFPAYLGDATRGIEKVGTIEQPDLEAIAALEPDLILSSKVRHEAIYDQLSSIAPTVFAEDVGVTWKENFALDAKALGREARGRELEAEYDAKVAGLREALGARRAETEVSVVRSVGDEVRIYLEGNFLGTVLGDVGLARPSTQQSDEFSETATPERIPELDGDVMILSRYGDDHRLLSRLTGNRLWDRLSVARAQRIYEVPDDLWFLGIGNLAARKVLDQMRTVLIDGRRLPGDDGDPTTA